MNRAPLLVASDLRVDVGDGPACDGLSFRTNGEHVLVLGAPSALFRAVVGRLRVVRGRLDVRGLPAFEAARKGIVTGVSAGLTAPGEWTVLEYVTWSARLSGLAGERAHASVASALDKLDLGGMAKTPMARLALAARHAALVASALATSAEVVAIEDPLAGLSEETGDAYGAVLAAALADRVSIVFAPRMPLASALARAADDAIVATAERVDAQGPPAELASADRRFRARFDGPIDAISGVLAERGVRVEAAGAHIDLDLGAELGTGELIEICDRAGLAVVELVPAVRALT